METALRSLVVQRAGGRCEYCRFPEVFAYNPYQIDHIIAQQHHGPASEENLAWSCFYRNTHKDPNIAGWIPERDKVIRLYHPRKDIWTEHFEWSGALLIARTEVGRATIDVLNINHPDAVAVRRMLLDYGESS